MNKTEIKNKIEISIIKDISFVKNSNTTSLNQKEAKSFLNEKEGDNINSSSSSSSSSSGMMDGDCIGLRKSDALDNKKRRKYSIFEVNADIEVNDGFSNLTEIEKRVSRTQLFYIACISIIGKITSIKKHTLIKNHKVVPIILDINNVLKSSKQTIDGFESIDSYDVLKSFLVKDHVNLVFSRIKKLSKVILEDGLDSSLRPDISKLSKKFWNVNFTKDCSRKPYEFIRSLMNECTIAWFLKSDTNIITKKRLMLIGYSKVFDLSDSSQHQFSNFDLYFNMIVRDILKDSSELTNQSIRISKIKSFKNNNDDDDDISIRGELKDKKKLMMIFPNPFFTK